MTPPITGFDPLWDDGPTSVLAPLAAPAPSYVPSWPDRVGARNLLEAISVPTWIDDGSHVIFANGALLRLSGRTLDMLATMPSVELLAPDDRDGWLQARAQCLQDGSEPPAQTALLLARDLSVRHVELSLRRIDLEGTPAVLVTCQDQSDMHHVQTSLENLFEMTRQIIHSNPVAAFVIDAEHRITDWNKACENLTGVPATKMRGTHWAWEPFYPTARPLLCDLLLDGADHAQLQGYYGDQVRPSGIVEGAFEAEAFFPDVNGRGRWLYLTAALLKDSSGKVMGAVETLQDVTDRHNTEEALRRHSDELEDVVADRSERLTRTSRELEYFIDHAPLGLMLLVKGTITRVNQSIEVLLGRNADSLLGLTIDDLFVQAQDRLIVTRLVGHQTGPQPLVDHETWMTHVSGKRLWVQINAHATKYDAAANRVWLMLQDRTEVHSAQTELNTRFLEIQETNHRLAEAQNQLLQSEKMASIGQLAAGVAHEINNPVGFVSSNLHTLHQYVDEMMTLLGAAVAAAEHPEDAQARSALTQTQRSIDLEYLREDVPQLLKESSDGLVRVKKIVQDLKDFSRIDQAEWQDADINAGLESTLNVVWHEVKYKATVNKQLGALPPVHCLAGQINQVIMNLIVNASHAIASQGEITLASGQVNDWVWFSVSDNGSGMSEEVRRRVFEPFFTTKEVGKGTGLGLSLSFSIVQKHGGSIQIESTVGQGSCFRVWLPIAGPDPSGTVRQPPALEDRA